MISHLTTGYDLLDLLSELLDLLSEQIDLAAGLSVTATRSRMLLADPRA